jgi:nitrogen regulatory protein P-II 1
MFMIMLVLNNPDQCPLVLGAWGEAGAPGVTVLPSSGLGRIQEKMGLYDDVPLMPSLQDFLQEEEGTHRTLIVILRERAVVDRIIQATQAVLGDLNRPHIGILAVLPVLEVYGLDRFNE